MTAPNISANTSILGKTAGVKVTSTTTTSALANAASSGTVLKINSIIAANINASSSVDISISLYDGSTDWYVVKGVSIPVGATQIVLAKESYLYVEEGRSIRVKASLANSVDLLLSYEEIAE